MSKQETISRLIEDLANFRTRAAARRQLAAFGMAAAEPLMAVLADAERPENMRWAAILLLQECACTAACPLLLEVLRSQDGLRGTAIEALEALTGLPIGDDADEWEKALADPEGYRDVFERAQDHAVEEADPNATGCELFRRALADEATELTWEEEGYLYIRIPLEAGRKQQIVATFNEENSSGERLTTLYTECGAPLPEFLESLSERNAALKYGKLSVEEADDGTSKVVMREAIPSRTLTPELVRDVVLTLAADADLLELEMTGADHI